MKNTTSWWIGLLLVLVGQSAWAADTILLTDDFNDASLDGSKWTIIKATGNGSGFDETSAGNSLTESGGSMNITQGSSNAGGAYKTALLPVNAEKVITIQRRTKVHYVNSYTSMGESLVNESGSGLLNWGYFNYNYGGTIRYGFGGTYDTRVSGVWDTWFDEVITYDPVTGQGSYALNGGAPVAISGAAMPAGTTSVYLRGCAYGWNTGNTKQFDSFSVSQEALPNPTVVTNLLVEQIEGSRNVQLSYDLVTPGHVLIDLDVLQNGSNINASSLSGALGLLESGTNQMITWNAGADWNGQVGDLTFNLLLEDGVPSAADINGAINLARTGQTNSYATADDGALQTGVAFPSPRFTSNGNSTMTDNLTGLVWWRYPINRSTWEGAMDYAVYANTETYGGRSDWRLANIRELISLLEFDTVPMIAVDQPFSSLPEYFWSSTRFMADTGYTISLFHGYTEIGTWRPTLYAALVAGESTNAPACVQKTGKKDSDRAGDDGDTEYGASVDGDRFADNGNGTVTDNLTGLMWLKDAGVISKTNWASAVSICENLNFAGHTDWRLPNLREQESLLDYGQAAIVGTAPLPIGHPFTSVEMIYWTSTTYHSDTNRAHYVRADSYPGLFLDYKYNNRNVWPVRSGN